MTDDVSGPDARRRNRFVRTETVMAVFSGSPKLDYVRFRDDTDKVLDQDPTPRA